MFTQGFYKTASQEYHDEIIHHAAEGTHDKMSPGAVSHLKKLMEHAQKKKKAFTLNHSDGRFMKFEKVAAKKKDGALVSHPYSLTGALLGGVSGHQAAKYIGIKGKSLKQKVARILIAAAAADRTARIKLHGDTPKRK